jgi:hypothetical protein
MDDDFRITLEFPGSPDEDGHVQLGAFVNFLQTLLNAVRQADKAATGGQSVKVRIVELSHNSPYAVAAELLPADPKHDDRARVMQGVRYLRRVIDEPEQEAEVVLYPMLEAFEDLTAQLGKVVPDATLRVGDDVIPLSPALHERIGKMLAPVMSAIGSVEGRLEYINIHGGANVFNVYPTIGPTKVKCHFSKELEEEATGAVGRVIRVHGITRYRAGARFPNEVDATSILVLRPEKDLPLLADLRGTSQVPSGEPSEEVVRRIRNGWE